MLLLFQGGPHFQVPAVCFQGLFSWEKSTTKDEALIIGFTYIRLEISPTKPLSPSCFSRQTPYVVGISISKEISKFDHSAGKKQKQQPQPPQQNLQQLPLLIFLVFSGALYEPTNHCPAAKWVSPQRGATRWLGADTSCHAATSARYPRSSAGGESPRGGLWCHFQI